jgi:SAM-dependent methyltransferase
MKKWKDFFQSYRVIEINNDSDLLFQVGATTSGKPITLGQHTAIVSSIVSGLAMNKNDNILDLCCGNGIITFDIADKVNKIIGIDSSKAYIDNAKKYKQKENIKYLNNDVLDLETYVDVGKLTKGFIYSSIAYFSESEILNLLSILKNIGVDYVYIGSILDKSKKFLFFNTFKRRVHYLYEYLLLNKDLGLGRWWSQKEILRIANKIGYEVEFITQNPILHTAHYRYDAILRSL